MREGTLSVPHCPDDGLATAASAQTALFWERSIRNNKKEFFYPTGRAAHGQCPAQIVLLLLWPFFPGDGFSDVSHLNLTASVQEGVSS